MVPDNCSIKKKIHIDQVELMHLFLFFSFSLFNSKVDIALL